MSDRARQTAEDRWAGIVRRRQRATAGEHDARVGRHLDGATIIGGLGALGALVALTVVAGLPGAVVGAVVGVVWYVSEEWLAYVAAHVGALVAFPDGVPFFQFLPVEFGLLVVLFGSLRDSPPRHRVLGVSLLTLCLVGGLALVTYSAVGSLVGTAIVAFAVGVGAAYTAHRYELVRLGLLGGERA